MDTIDAAEGSVPDRPDGAFPAGCAFRMAASLPGPVGDHFPFAAVLPKLPLWSRPRARFSRFQIGLRMFLKANSQVSDV